MSWHENSRVWCSQCCYKKTVEWEKKNPRDANNHIAPKSVSYWNNSFFGRDHTWKRSAGEVLESYEGLNQGLETGNYYKIWINAVTLLLQLLTYLISYSVRKITWLTQKIKMLTFQPESISLSISIVCQLKKVQKLAKSSWHDIIF